MREKLKQIKQEISSDDPRLPLVKLLCAALRDADQAECQNGNEEGISDQEIVKIFSRMIEKRKLSAGKRRAEGQSSQAAAEEQEIALIESLMPPQIEGEELMTLVHNLAEESGLALENAAGWVLRTAKARYPGQTNSNNVMQALRNLGLSMDSDANHRCRSPHCGSGISAAS